MEDWYQKEKQREKYLKSESPLNYKTELSQEKKESILRDIYNSIQLFYRLVYEAKKESSKD